MKTSYEVKILKVKIFPGQTTRGLYIVLYEHCCFGERTKQVCAALHSNPISEFAYGSEEIA